MNRPSSRQGRAALEQGILVKDGQHYRYYRPSGRRFNPETVARLVEQGAVRRIEALKGEPDDD